jgi:pantothenate kinase
MMPPVMDQTDPIPPNAVRLSVAGLDVVVAPTEEELRGPIGDLFGLFGEALKGMPADRRAIVGLAGVPGSGKSTLATLLAYVSTRCDRPVPAAAVSIDGWHWPNARLDEMTATGPKGEPVSMRARKGSPGSYDVAGIVAAMAALREAYMPARLPAYDRRLHEPVPGALVIPPGVRLILFEGNYILSHEEPWRQAAEQLDVALFLDADLALCREAVIRRHVIGGASRAEAERKYESNDRLNADVVLASKRFADAVVHVDADHRLTLVEVLRRRFSGAARLSRFPSLHSRRE